VSLVNGVAPLTFPFDLTAVHICAQTEAHSDAGSHIGGREKKRIKNYTVPVDLVFIVRNHKFRGWILDALMHTLREGGIQNFKLFYY
jgi:hypothetical protein